MGINTNAVQRLYVAYFNRPGDPVGMAHWEGLLPATAATQAQLATIAASFSGSAEYAALYAGQSNTSIVNNLYLNLFGRAAESAGLLSWAGKLTAGTETFASIALQLTYSAQGTDATAIANKLTAANSFTTALDTAAEIVGYSGTAAATSGRTYLAAVTDVAATLTTSASGLTASVAAAVAAGTSAAGTTFTLTTGADTLTGTSNDDTFVGVVDASVTTNSTLAAVDNITGGSGTDTFNITTQGGTAIADALNSSLASGIETINLRAISTAGTAFNANNALGLTTLNNKMSTDALTVTNLASTTALVITGNTAVTNGATTATYAAGATAGAVTFDGGTTAGAVAVNGAGFTTLTINSTGAHNTIGALSSSGTAIATTTIAATTGFTTTGLTVGTVPSGGQKLVISGAATDQAATVTAGATSAVVLGAADTDFTSINAAGLSAGGVSVTLSATVAATFTGGAGGDTVTTSVTGQTGAVNAGSGTDTLVLANSVDLDTTAEGLIYAGFEKLKTTGTAAINMSLITGSTIVAIESGGTGAITEMTATQGANVTVSSAAATLTLGIKDATVVATSDTMNITVTDRDTTTSEALVSGTWTIAGVETINITATDDVSFTAMNLITGVTAVNVSGVGDVAMTSGAHVVTSNESINFSALTTASTFDFSAATTNALGFTGGSGVDTVTDSVVGGNVITTGAGRDVVNLTAKTGGASSNQITLGAGGDSLVNTLNIGNDARDQLTLKYVSTDSVIDTSVAATGFVAATMDAITGVALVITATAATGSVITFDTDKTATAVTFASTVASWTAASVTNAYDFYVFNTGAGGITYVYQDTDGDKIIENGEFGVQLTGTTAIATTTGEFTIVSGNLLFTSAT